MRPADERCYYISRYAPSQWEMSLQGNNTSHWLGTYWSLHPKSAYIFDGMYCMMTQPAWLNVGQWVMGHWLIGLLQRHSLMESDYLLPPTGAYFIFKLRKEVINWRYLNNLCSLLAIMPSGNRTEIEVLPCLPVDVIGVTVISLM